MFSAALMHEFPAQNSHLVGLLGLAYASVCENMNWPEGSQLQPPPSGFAKSCNNKILQRMH
jgi:hypothetical protein